MPAGLIVCPQVLLCARRRGTFGRRWSQSTCLEVPERMGGKPQPELVNPDVSGAILISAPDVRESFDQRNLKLEAKKV